MATNNSALKQFSIRWPEDFWEAVAIEATKRRTSLQAIVTEAVSEKLGIPIVEVAEPATEARP